MQVVEEKVELIKEESPWKEEIEQLSNKIENFQKIFRFGPIDFQKLFLLLTGFRNIPEDKWVEQKTQFYQVLCFLKLGRLHRTGRADPKTWSGQSHKADAKGRIIIIKNKCVKLGKGSIALLSLQRNYSVQESTNVVLQYTDSALNASVYILGR